MTKVLITESTLEDIADAIRARNGTMKTFLPSEMPEAISMPGRAGGFIYPGWELGGINGNTGEDASANNRIRSNFFTLNYPYVAIVDPTASGQFYIDIHKYQLDGTYVPPATNTVNVYNGAVIGVALDTGYKYRLVSTALNGNPALINIPYDTSDIWLGCGAITNGNFSRVSSNMASLDPFSVTEPSVLKLNVPKCNVDLFYYQKNGTLAGNLSYRDTNNQLVYFPLSEKYIYRLYIASTSYTSVSGEISAETPFTQVVGGMDPATGTAAASTGNTRTSLIRPGEYKYATVSNVQSVRCVKFKDGVWLSQTQVFTNQWSPAVVYVGDCDYFCFLGNGTTGISCALTNDAPLYGKKWASYGDSITEARPWGQWQDHLVAKYGLVHSNHGLGGSCVTGDTTCSVTPMTDDTRINAIAADTDIITVMGGTNDFGYCTDMGSLEELQTSNDISTFIGSVATIVKKLQVHCPNAKIILMSNINSRGTTGQNRDSQEIGPYGYTPYDFAVAMKQAAEWLSVAYVDMWSCGINQLNRATYIQDSVHPNAAGGQLIARKLMEYFDVLEL